MSFVKMKSGILFVMCVLVAAFALVSIPARSFSEEVPSTSRTEHWTFFSEDNLSSAALNSIETSANPMMPDVSTKENTASKIVVADACLAHLQQAKSALQKNATNSVQPIAGQKTAGGAAALSLIFGVRYALGPVEAPGAVKAGQTPAVQIDGQRATAIAQYRRCRSDHNLAQNLVTL